MPQNPALKLKIDEVLASGQDRQAVINHLVSEKIITTNELTDYFPEFPLKAKEANPFKEVVRSATPIISGGAGVLTERALSIPSYGVPQAASMFGGSLMMAAVDNYLKQYTGERDKEDGIVQNLSDVSKDVALDVVGGYGINKALKFGVNKPINAVINAIKESDVNDLGLQGGLAKVRDRFLSMVKKPDLFGAVGRESVVTGKTDLLKLGPTYGQLKNSEFFNKMEDYLDPVGKRKALLESTISAKKEVTKLAENITGTFGDLTTPLPQAKRVRANAKQQYDALTNASNARGTAAKDIAELSANRYFYDNYKTIQK